jgi:hypothetical protein
MSSYVARLIALIKDMDLGLGGITPPPLPAQAAFPYVTVTQLFSKEAESLTGPSGKLRSLMQINVFHKTYEAAWNTRKTIKSTLFALTPSDDNGLRAVNHNQDNELYDGNSSAHQLITRLFIWWDSEEDE